MLPAMHEQGAAHMADGYYRSSGEIAVVLTSGAGENQSPTFSPDGRRIAYTSRRDGRFQIWVMDLDGGNGHKLTTEGGSDLADWSRSVPEK